MTIIRGDSATGKTTLVDMIQEYVNNPTGSPVDLTCDKKCYVLEGALWKGQLAEITDSIVFIDEEMILSRLRSLPEKFRKQTIIM